MALFGHLESVKGCVVGENGRIKHICGGGAVIEFDNLRQEDPNVAGEFIPVKARAFPCQLAHLEKIGARARRGAEELIAMMKQ